jgi:DNA-binding LytR/AlgR family response regulator
MDLLRGPWPVNDGDAGDGRRKQRIPQGVVTAMASVPKSLDVLVVDDEPLARRRVVRLLRQLPWIGRVQEAADVDDAATQCERTGPDIVLLDIQMPGGSGFDLVQRLAKHDGGTGMPVVVFVTAFDDQALRAFDASATDYITKPIEPGRFRLAMERARQAAGLRNNAQRIAELESVVASLRRGLATPAGPASELWVKFQGQYLRVPGASISRIQAERDYARIHADGRSYLHNLSLAELERQLPATEFLRVHRSTLVRIDAVKRMAVGPFSSLALVLADGTTVRVGRTYTTAVRARLLAMPQ